MNKLIARLQTRIPLQDQRSRKATYNSILNFIIKIIGFGMSLILVPMTIHYLNPASYGVWLTLTSIATFVTFFDFGLGNGLRNYFAQALAKGDHALARTYLSTAYTLYGLIQLGVILLFVLVNSFINWQRVLNTPYPETSLQTVAAITFVGISVKMLFDLVNAVLLARQEPAKQGLIIIPSTMLILGGTYLLTRFTTGNLVYLTLLSSAVPIVVTIGVSIYLFRTSLQDYVPSWRWVDFRYSKELISLGYKFFLIQFCALIIFSTDSLLISQLFNPEEVARYNIAYRYITFVYTAFSIVAAPYWSAITEAYSKNEMDWLNQAYSNLKKVWIVATLGIIVLIFLSSYFYPLWIGDELVIPFHLTVAMGLYGIINCWNTILASVQNGTGKVKLQLIFAVLAAVINIPLAIYLAKHLALGSVGIILATCVSLLICGVFGTIQVQRLLKQRAQGIWNQ